MGEPTQEWCWYLEGGSFYGGFASRRDAVRDALSNDYPRALVGTVVDAPDAIARYVSADDIAEHIGCEMATDEGVRALPGAQAALEEWARTYLEHGYSSVCLDGSDITADAMEKWVERVKAHRRAK